MQLIATLTLLNGDRQSQRWALRPQEVFRIGRAEDNHARPEARGLSRNHAEIVFQQGQWRVRDLGSTNGILVDGVLVPKRSEAGLKHNSKIQAGSAVFLFRAWDPRAHICALCGEGELFDEEAIVPPPFARKDVLLCVNCGGALRAGPDGRRFDFVFVPRLFARNRERMGEGPFALQDLIMFGEAVLDELEEEHYQRQGEEAPQAPPAPRPAAPPEPAPAAQATQGAHPSPPKQAPRPAQPAAPQPAPPLVKKAPTPAPAKPATPAGNSPEPPRKQSPQQPEGKGAQAPPSKPPAPKAPPPPTRQIILPSLRIGGKSSAAQALEVLERAKGKEAGG